MKKITLLIALMITSLGFAQNLITNGDFANGTTGWTFGAPGVVLDGEAYYSTANAGGNPWDTELKQTEKSFTGGNSYTLTFRARAAANRNISVNIQNTGIWNDQFRNDAVALTTTMTSYTYTFVATSTNSNAQLNFHMANLGTNTTAAVYIDDVTLTLAGISTCNNGVQDGTETGIDCGGTCAPCPPPPPTVAAPTPLPRPAADVVSIYSDAYTSISPINLDAGWCGANSVVATTAGGNNVFAYKGNACQGITFPSATQNLTGFTNIHVDFFILAGTNTDGKVFNLKTVALNGTAVEINIDMNLLSPPAVPGTWYSFDRAFTPGQLATLAANPIMHEFGVTSNLQNAVWYDNLYLHKNTLLGTASFAKSNIKMYPNPVKNFLNIEANSSIDNVTVYNILGQEVMKVSPKSNSATLQTADLQKGVYMITTDIEGNISTSKFVKE